MSNKFEDPFANMPEENKPNFVAKKAIWESHKITSKLAEETGMKKETNPKQATQIIPDKFGKTIDKSLLAEERLTARKTPEKIGYPVTDAIVNSTDSNRIEDLEPQTQDEEDKYIKGIIPNENDKKREEIRKKQDIDKPYA